MFLGWPVRIPLIPHCLLQFLLNWPAECFFICKYYFWILSCTFSGRQWLISSSPLLPSWRSSIYVNNILLAVQCSAVQCSAVQCTAVQCSTVQCSAVAYIMRNTIKHVMFFSYEHHGGKEGHLSRVQSKDWDFPEGHRGLSTVFFCNVLHHTETYSNML